MRAWLNAIGYQVASLAVMYFAGIERPWLGIAACLVFAVVQLYFSRTRTGDVFAMLTAFVVGFVLDGLWAAGGWVTYASPSPALFAPAWILALWVAFAMTFNHSLRWMRGRLWLAALGGAIGGPLAYWGAERVFSAVALPSPPWTSFASLAISWAMAVPLIARAAALGEPASSLHHQGARS